jgi:hypothetical protein
MDLVTALEGIREDIATPEQWWDGRGSFAQMAGKNCLMQACFRATALAPIGTLQDYERARESLRGVVGGELTTFNDTHTHAEVLAAVDAAIATAKLEK